MDTIDIKRGGVMDNTDYKHKNGSTYRVMYIAIQEADMSPVVVYQLAAGGPVWSRSAKEFFDGRFKPHLSQHAITERSE